MNFSRDGWGCNGSIARLGTVARPPGRQRENASRAGARRPPRPGTAQALKSGLPLQNRVHDRVLECRITRREQLFALRRARSAAKAGVQSYLRSSRSCSSIARTSMLPSRAEGHFEATWIASFRSRAAIRKNPPSCSFVSANGPSWT